MEIIRYHASKEKNAIHKTTPKIKLLILAVLGFLLIGLTITNVPVVYSNSSSDIEDGEGEQEESSDVEEESSDGEEESSDGEEESSDVEEEQSVENEEICGNGEDDDDDGKIDNDDSDCEQQQQGQNEEICGNGEDDDDDGNIDNDDSDCKTEICGNGEDDDDDGKIDNDDSDCKTELRATGTFIVQVKNDNGGSKQPQDFKLRIKVSEGKASPSNFVAAGPPGTTVEFTGGGKFSVNTMRPSDYTESMGTDCPSGQIPQTFTCTFTYDDQEDPCRKPGLACFKVEGVVSGGSVIGKISAPDTGATTTPDPDTGATTTLGPETEQGIPKPPLTSQPFTTYKSDEKSVSVNYPHDWLITENANNVTIKSPHESSSDKFEEALRVLKVPYKNSLSALTEEIVGEAKANLPSFQIVNSSDTILGGIPANSLVYIYTDDRVGTLQEMVILTIKDDSAYIIGYTAESPKYTYYLPVVQKMINSIQIGDNKAETSLLPFIPQHTPTGDEIG